MIAENIRNIRKKIAEACIVAQRDPGSVKLIAVSKTFGPEKVEEAVRAGVLDIGENYVQEIGRKRETLADEHVRWHFIGHLQSNKVKYIADWIWLIHSVESESVAAEIQKRGEKLNRAVDVLIEVNTSGETSKFGVRPGAAPDFVRTFARYPNIRLKGLMTIGSFLPDPEQSRPAFRILKKTLDDINGMDILREPMSQLSMGMTHDYAVAIEEGSTIVRIGTAIFGSRRLTTSN